MTRGGPVVYVETSDGPREGGTADTRQSLDAVEARVETVERERVSGEYFGADERPVCLVLDLGDGEWVDPFERARVAEPPVPVVLVGDEADRTAAARVALTADGVFMVDPSTVPDAVEHAIAADRKLRERYEAASRLAAFFEHNPDPTVEYEFVDGEPYIRSANRAFVDTFGYERAAVRDRPMNEVLVPPEKVEEAASLDERVRKGEDVTAELRRETTDGQRTFLFKNIGIDTGADSPDGYGIYVDITEQKERERRLEEQNARLNDFASVVTHDIRSPMEVVKNHIDIARETGELERLDRAGAALDRMDDLVRELLQLARQGEDLSRTEPTSLASIARAAWRHVATGEETLVVDDDAVLEADAGRLSQALENLYINAVEHSGEASPVTVTVGVTDDGEGVYVADDGRGIPPEDRERVFKGGYSSGSDTSGYGLTIVRQVASAHGWDVAVTDSDRGGARFEFRDVTFLDP